jgi:glycosyltransferase
MAVSNHQFGIIIPSFNDARILHSISSVRAADSGNLARIYVIDALSKPELLRSIERSLRHQDVLVSESDRGIFDALNKGLDQTTEPYIGWLGADDFYPPDLRFSELLSDLESHRLDVILMDTVFVDGFRVRRRTIASPPTKMNYKLGLLVPHFSSFWRKERIGKERFDIAYKNAADQGFFLGLISNGPLKYKVDNRVGLIARLGGASTGGVRRILRANLSSIALYRRHMGLPTALVAVMMKLLRKVYWSLRFRPYPVIDGLSDAIVKLIEDSNRPGDSR